MFLLVVAVSTLAGGQCDLTWRAVGEGAELGDLGVAHLGDEPGDETPVEGTHEVRVENQFIGDTNTIISVSEGQTGMIVVQW